MQGFVDLGLLRPMLGYALERTLQLALSEISRFPYDCIGDDLLHNL